MNMNKLGNILKENHNALLRHNVNNGNITISNNVTNVSELTLEELIKLFEEKFSDENSRRQWLATYLAENLANTKDLNYFKFIVKQYSGTLLLECLSLTNEARKDNLIKTTPARYFVGVLKRKLRKGVM